MPHCSRAHGQPRRAKHRDQGRSERLPGVCRRRLLQLRAAAQLRSCALCRRGVRWSGKQRPAGPGVRVPRVLGASHGCSTPAAMLIQRGAALLRGAWSHAELGVPQNLRAWSAAGEPLLAISVLAGPFPPRRTCCRRAGVVLCCVFALGCVLTVHAPPSSTGAAAASQGVVSPAPVVGRWTWEAGLDPGARRSWVRSVP